MGRLVFQKLFNKFIYSIFIEKISSVISQTYTLLCSEGDVTTNRVFHIFAAKPKKPKQELHLQI